MANGLLSLKWNNHRSTFFHVLSTIRSKESYSDVTFACDGNFYSLHKFVLSTCSEYFEEIFERTEGKHSVIVLNGIKHEDFEILLNYMYVGEVTVVQERLPGLLKAAECLKIKGLAVADEDPMESKENITREQHKRSQRTEDSPRAKRRRRENSTDVSEDVLSPVRSRPTARSRDHQSNSQSTKTNALSNEDHFQNDSREEDRQKNVPKDADNSSSNTHRQGLSNSRINSQSTSHKKEHVPEEVIVEDTDIKAELIEIENDVKDSFHNELGFDASDSMGGDDDNYVDVDPSMLGGQHQSVEDVVAQAMPGSSGFQENSFPMWEGEGSLSNFPVEGFSGDNSQARQMVAEGPADLLWSSALRLSSDRGPVSTARATAGLALFAADGGSFTEGTGARGHHPGSRSSSLPTTGGGSGARHLACPYESCVKLFNRPSQLQRHILTHTGERPFACTHCHYRCKQKIHLKIHLSTCKKAKEADSDRMN